MDRYEYKVRVAQIKSLIASKDFYEAMNIVDTIDWRRVRSASMLGMVSEIYKVNRRYDDAKGILMMMYNRNPELRTTVYALCEISIKLGEITDAVKYLKEYMRLAKGDSGVYILQYKLYRSQGVGLGECIELLKKLKAVEYDERWAYELAYLYHLDGQEKNCIDECDELIVWFGRGKYVTKAMELKMEHVSLTEDQQRKYNQSGAKLRSNGELEENGDENDLEEAELRLGDEVRDTKPHKLQKAEKVQVRERVKEAEPAEEIEETAEEIAEETEPETETEVNAEAEARAKAEVESEARFEDAKPEPLPEKAPVKSDPSMSIEIKSVDVSDQPTKRIPHQEILNRINIDEIEIKPFNTGVYSTVNLQDEIRKNLAEFAKRTGQPIHEKEERIIPFETEERKRPVSEAKKTAEYTGDITAEMTGELPGDISAEMTGELPGDITAEMTGELPGDITAEMTAEDELPKIAAGKTAQSKQFKRRYEQDEEVEFEERSIRENDRPKEIKAESQKARKVKKSRKNDDAEIKAKKKYKAPQPKEVTGFTDEEKEIFADFLAMHELPELIKSALDNIEMVGNRGNVIITGNEESARVRLAGALANDLRETNPDFLGKIAKIKSDLLNKKDIKKAIRSLDTGALLIERAGDLSEKSLETIKEMLDNQDTNIVLFLEDARLTMKKTLASHEWMEDFFNVNINIPTYTNDDLVFHAREYARQREYAIDDMGVLALYTRIDEMQTADHSVNINEVEKIVDSAINHADRRTPGHLIDLIVGKRYDDNDLIVLREKDFSI
ncbi:tetratricopeptide repeat protein [Lachnospiraceae bacterium C1.1]|nr:hypothetical protein [Lachnospiraceae bacterium C1.1]